MSKTKTEPKKETETKKEVSKLFADTNYTTKSGKLLKDPILISDGKFAKIIFSSTKEYLDKNEEVKTTTNYFNALVSSNLENAFETTKTLKEGDLIYLKGEDRTRLVDTIEGYKETALTIHVNKIGLKKVNGNQPSNQDADAAPSPAQQ